MQLSSRTHCGNQKPCVDRAKPAIFSHVVFVVAILCANVFSTLAVDPNQPPGRNFDLSHWYLTLPDSSASSVSASKLISGYTNASWFYTDADGAMVFYSPVNGGRTDNSQNSRCELRELVDGSDTSENWRAPGTHILDAQFKILQVPSTGLFFLGQIHGYGDGVPVLMLLRYNNGLIQTQLRNDISVSNGVYFPMTTVALNELITYQIKFANGILTVTVNGFTQTINVYDYEPAWADQEFYFKAGAYNQDNVGPSSEGTRLAFYQLNVTHLPPPVAPSISTQPVSQTTNEGASVTLRVVAKGTPPFFQWRKDGADLGNATNSTLTIANVTTNDAGNYTVIITNDAGSVTSAVARLTITSEAPARALRDSLDSSNLVWTVNGPSPWFAQTDVTHDGEDAAQSGPIGHSQTTVLQTTVTGPGVIAYWWKVSSEPSNDRLAFSVAGSEKARISGEVDWQWKTFPISSGAQVLKWIYSKNSSKTGGLDRAWVDQVMFIPNSIPTAPIIAMAPVSTNVEAGAKANFTVGAVGSATLRYQWRCNGTNLINSSGTGVSGATTATLTLANVQLAHAGIYSVIVSNAVGVATNSDAVLTVTPIITLGEALDRTGLVWTTSSSFGWTGQTNVTHDDIDAARSGAVAAGKSAYIQTTVTGPGVLSFWWKVSSEPGNDRLRFYVNGAEQARVSGEIGWTQRVYNLPPGTQTLQWKYSKDDGISLGQDRAWVDQVEFGPNVIPNPLAPKSLARLVPLIVSVSDGKVLLSWNAAPNKTYQVLYVESLEKADWTELPADISITDTVATLEEAISETQRFYQVIEQ